MILLPEWLFSIREEALTLWHLCARVLIVYIITLMLMRIDRQIIGVPTIFNFVLNVLLGSLLANGIIGDAPFLPVLGAAIFITMLNIACAWLTYASPFLDYVITGSRKVLVKDGVIQWHEMRRNFITHDELMSVLHHQTQLSDLKHVQFAYLEKSGEISFVVKK